MASAESCVVPFVNLLAVQPRTVLELPEALHKLYDTEFIPRRVYVRQEMIDLWYELATVPMPNWNRKHNIVGGSPGVGKSLAVYLFVLHVVKTYGVTFYHMRHLKGDSRELRVCRLTRTSDRNGVMVEKIDSVTDISDLPRLSHDDHPYAFVDGVKYHDKVNEYSARISPVFWCSSVHAEIKSEEWAHVSLYGLSPWSFEDLRSAVEAGVVPDLNIDDPEQKLEMHWLYLGGIFRGLHYDEANYIAFCNVAVEGVKSGETQLRYRVTAGQKDTVTYTHYTRDENGALRKSCCIGSDYFATQIYEQLSLDLIEKFLAVALQMSRSVYGGVFQAYVQRKIETQIETGISHAGIAGEYKGYDWVIHMAKIKDDTRKWEDVTITVKEVIFTESTTLRDTLEEIRRITSAGKHEGMLFIPKFEQFPLADWLIYYNGVIYLINATVGKSRSFKIEYLKGLLECMGWKGDEMGFRVVYYEPDENHCKEFKLKDNVHENQRGTRNEKYPSIHPCIGYGDFSISVSGPKIRSTRPVPPVVDLEKVRKIRMVGGLGNDTLDELTALAETNNMRIVDVKGDGNCQFRAIARAVMGDEENYQVYRLIAANQLVAGEYNAGVVLGDEFDAYGGNVERFANAIAAARSTVWGNQATLQAITDANRFEFLVLSTLDGIFQVTPREGEVTRTIVLGHYGEMHYVCLENRD